MTYGKLGSPSWMATTFFIICTLLEDSFLLFEVKPYLDNIIELHAIRKIFGLANIIFGCFQVANLLAIVALIVTERRLTFRASRHCHRIPQYAGRKLLVHDYTKCFQDVTYCTLYRMRLFVNWRVVKLLLGAQLCLFHLASAVKDDQKSLKKRKRRGIAAIKYVDLHGQVPIYMYVSLLASNSPANAPRYSPSRQQRRLACLGPVAVAMTLGHPTRRAPEDDEMSPWPTKVPMADKSPQPQ